VTAREVSKPKEIRDLLIRQITGMVRWRESVLYMHSRGIRELIEIGTGKVLSGLAKRIHREMTGISLGTPADIGALFAPA
jgi:[acyl-carrier-protein] S-malonyltransferase